MNIYIIEPPSPSKNGVQRIYGGNGSNKSDFRKVPVDVLWMSGYLRKNGFDNIYGPHSGEPGTDQKYGDKKSGMLGVPDYNVNTFGINYSASKQAPKKDDKDAKEEEE